MSRSVEKLEGLHILVAEDEILILLDIQDILAHASRIVVVASPRRHLVPADPGTRISPSDRSSARPSPRFPRQNS